MTWKRPSQISGNNGTIDGQGEMWWEMWWNRTLNYTRGHLVELANSTNILISNITLRNSPFWTVHPVYSRSVYHVVSTFFLHFLTENASSFFTLLKPSTEQENFFFFLFISNVVIKGLTILAPLNAPNTDGIDPGLCCCFHHIFLLPSPFW